MRRIVLAFGVVALVTAGTSACATKKFVRTRVGEVNDKVTTLSKSLEETQERTRQNEQKISEVDTRVTTVDTRVTTVADESRAGIEKVSLRADEIERATKRLVYEVVISEDQGNFKFAKSDLPDEAKSELDRLVQQLKADPKGAYIEIEGHTDNVGPLQVNKRIGLERAESVKRYLYEQHQVPLHKMNVITYGEEKPVAPNDTRDGRAQNRRVVVKVLT
ncbi:MAG TPA: OmpA family protein [Vicinamibacterales bacterium]|nr:OmpA family protein [Vicinamibacterales bacterium]